MQSVLRSLTCKDLHPDTYPQEWLLSIKYISCQWLNNIEAAQFIHSLAEGPDPRQNKMRGLIHVLNIIGNFSGYPDPFDHVKNRTDIAASIIDQADAYCMASRLLGLINIIGFSADDSIHQVLYFPL